MLTTETATAIRAFVQQRMVELHYDSLTLLLFGGEPLLNPLGCLDLLRAMDQLGMVHAEMISNTVLLRPALARRLSAAGLRRIQVTFDGARSDHDRTRVDHRGHGTYDRILANIRAAAQAVPALQWHYRVNISHHNLERVEELIDDLTAIATSAPASLHLTLIDDVGIGYDNELSYSPSLAERFIALADKAIDAGLRIPVTADAVADCPFCGEYAGRSGAVVNADGVLYSCWETAGRPDWAVGSVTDGYLDDETISNRWVACDYAAASHGPSAAAATFHDRVDSFVLDRTYRNRSAAATA